MLKNYTYKKEIEIGKYYGSQSISIQEILRIFLEIARKHGEQMNWNLGPNKVWMLYRWNLQVEELPSIGENIFIETRIVYVDKLYAYREFVMKKSCIPIAKAMAQMILVDRQQRELTVIPEELRKKSSHKKEIVDNMRFPKYRIVEDQKKFTFQYRDIDENGHLNNIAYVDYVIESIIEKDETINLNDSKSIELFKITYSKEILYPSDIIVSFLKEENKDYKFSISSGKGQEIHASGRIKLK